MKANLVSELDKVKKERDRISSIQYATEKKEKTIIEELDRLSYSINFEKLNNFLSEQPRTIKNYIDFLKEETISLNDSSKSLEKLQEWESVEQSRKDVESKMKESNPLWKSPDEARELFVQSDEYLKLKNSLENSKNKYRVEKNKLKSYMDQYPDIDKNDYTLRIMRSSINESSRQNEELTQQILELAEKDGLRIQDAKKLT